MCKLSTRIFAIALALLTAATAVIIAVSYSHFRRLSQNGLENAMLEDLNSLSVMIDNVYSVARRKLTIVAAEMRQSPFLLEINGASTVSEGMLLLRRLHHSFFAKLTVYAEMDSMFLVTGRYVAGYSMNKDLSLYSRRASLENATYASASSIVVDNFPQYSFNERDMIVCQIENDSFLVGMLNWTVIFDHWQGQDAYLFDAQERLLYPQNAGIPMTELTKQAGDTFYGARGQGGVLTFEQSIPDYGLHMFVTADSRDVDLRGTLLLILSLSGAIILLMGRIFFFLSVRLISPLERFSLQLNRIESFGDTEAVERFIGEQKTQRPFEKRIFHYYCILAFPLAVIMLLCFGIYHQVVRGWEMQSFRDATSQIVDGIQYSLQNQVQYSNYIALDERLQTQLVSYIERQAPLTDSGVITVEQYLNDASISGRLLYIKIYGADKKLLYTTGSDENTLPAHVAHYNEWSASDKSISLCKRINLLLDNRVSMPYFANLGYLEIALENQFLSPRGLYQDGFQGIVTEDGDIVEVSVQGRFNTGLAQQFVSRNPLGDETGTQLDFEGHGGFYSSRRISGTSWYYISFLTAPENTSQSLQLILFTVIGLLSLFVFVLAVSNLLAKEALRPLKYLEACMRGIKLTQVPEILFNQRYSEFARLADNFHSMLLRLNAMSAAVQQSRDERMEIEKRRNEARFVALQTQINPHFLHNIFASITMLIKMNQTEQAIRILQATGKLFRIGIYSDRSIVCVPEELEHVRAYVELQRIRFPHKLEFSVDNVDCARELMIPKLILQPLVENAIEHNEKSGRLIHIHIGFRRGEHLIVTVRDDGVGMDEPTLEKNRERLRRNVYSGQVGLVNINERIKLYFGEPFGLRIESSHETGAAVYITLPLIKEDQLNLNF